MDMGPVYYSEPDVRFAAERIRCTSPVARSDLSPEQERIVQALKQRDREVRAHEQAHLAAGGAYVIGGPAYAFQIGPDGKRYAVGGEVSIDTSEVPDNPEATLRKMEQVRRAALAPKDPSAADQRVASMASKMEAEARRELQGENHAGQDETAPPKNDLIQHAAEAYRQASEFFPTDYRLDLLV